MHFFCSCFASPLLLLAVHTWDFWVPWLLIKLINSSIPNEGRPKPSSSSLPLPFCPGNFLDGKNNKKEEEEGGGRS